MRAYFLVLVFILAAGETYSQSFGEDLKEFGNTGADLLKEIPPDKQQETIAYLTTLSLTTASYFIDKEMKHFTQNNKTPFLDAVFVFDKYYIEVLGAGTALLYLHGLISGNGKNQSLGLRLGESIVYSTLITNIIKMTAGRTRPFKTDDNGEFNFFQTSWEKTSFPSGHSNFIWAVAGILAGENSDPYFQTALYTVAALGAFARVYNNVHWLSDTVMGSAIGYLTAQFINDRHKNKLKEKEAAPPPPLFRISIPIN
ncbi:MAG: phosphatase PAP2 family protein [Ignavibacteriaceae bacterium]|nr:phosphatase PAP2 family protein [Ignavibacteriaceae bacterium]